MNEQIKTPKRIKIVVKIIIGLLLMSQIYIASAYVFNYIYWEDGIMHFQYKTIPFLDSVLIEEGRKSREFFDKLPELTPKEQIAKQETKEYLESQLSIQHLKECKECFGQDIAEIIILTPLVIMASIGLWRMKQWGMLIAFIVFGARIYYATTGLPYALSPEPVDTIGSYIILYTFLVIGIGYLWKNRKWFS